MKKTIIFCAGAPHAYLEVINHYTNPMLIGVDGGAQTLIQAGYGVDLAVGDFDSISVPDADEIIILPCDKDETDLQYALYHVLAQLEEEEVEHIIILGALGGGRLDHLVCNLWLGYEPRLQKWLPKLQLIDEHNSATFYLPGTYRLAKELNKKYLSFILMTPVNALTLTDVAYPLCQQDYKRPRSLISNEFLAEEMTFSFETGLICVMQTVD